MQESELLAVALARSPEAITMRLAGEVDFLTAPLVNSALVDACGMVVDEERVVIDLRRVTFFGGAGLTSLILAKKCCDARGLALVVVVASRMVFRALRCTGVDELVDVVDGTGQDDVQTG